VVTLLAIALPAAATAAPPPPAEPSAPYRVEGAGTPGERTAVARSGVDVLTGGRNAFEVRATDAQADRLRAAGFELQPLSEVPAPPFAGPERFPPGFGAYHTYDELGLALAVLAATHPDIVRVSSYGTSFEGRPLPLVKISDAVDTDEAEPEVLFSCAQHAREHLTVEMCLHIVTRLAEGHGTDPALTALVDSREVWVMPMTNPDGAEFDIATGAFALWRKNRQPTPGSIAIGTDPNRNWGTRWGCCGGSSDSPFADDYRGPAPFSAPETAQLRDWVGSRVIGGEQQITAHLDWHSFSELVLWPYGFTESDTAPGLDTDAAATFQALGEAMAATNGYTAQQSSDFYVTDGSVNDWMWTEYRIWSYTFEMYPPSQEQGGFYPTDNVIAPQTSRNDAAVDLLLSYADCVPRIIGVPCG
jgi:murein tripeptide amidase MpaA